MKDERSWMPGETDREWIESIAADLPPALAAIETAARPMGIPIVDREAGRVLSVLAGGRRRIVEVGTAYGFSTLWLALGQPADGTIVTIDPDAERTDLARGWWRDAGIPEERITVLTAKALEAFANGDPALAGPFDLAFIDALKPEYGAYLDALIDGRLAPGCPRPGRQRPLERARVRCDAGRRRGPEYQRPARIQRARPRRSAVHLDHPARRRRPARRHVARVIDRQGCVSAFVSSRSSASSPAPVRSRSSCGTVPRSPMRGPVWSPSIQPSNRGELRSGSPATGHTPTKRRRLPMGTRWR